MSDGVRSSAIKDGAGRDLGLLAALTGDFLQDALSDVTHIGGAAGEDLVLERGQAVGVVLVGPAPGEFGGLPLVDAAHREVHQIRVAQDLPMGGENGRLVGVGLVGQPVLQRLELDLRTGRWRRSAADVPGADRWSPR